MTFPKKLKIGGHTYAVQVVKVPHIAKDDGTCGLTSRVRGTIEIDASLIQSEREATLLHEILHVLNSEIPHMLIDSTAQQLYQVLHDNHMLR